MSYRRILFALSALSIASVSFGQVTVSLAGRTINKLLPDYQRPYVYALNAASGANPGTLVKLNSTNGAIQGEISLNLNPTDMAMSPGGDSLYVINAGSRTISRVDLGTFTTVAEKAITTPNTYNSANALHLVVGRSNLVYFTDGGWAPNITTFNYAAGTNVTVYDDGNGAGGLAITSDGKTLFRWRQYGWGAGNVNSWVTRYDTLTNVNLTPLEDSFTSWRRDPFDTPILLDAAARWVFNKQQMFSATNVSVLLNQFGDNIYALSLDGSVAFGPTQVYNTQSGATLTNFPVNTGVQTLSGDQKKLFRYSAAASNVAIYDMATIASISGPELIPTPANGSVVSPPLTNLTWTPSPTALSYGVYFGTNQTDVANATVASALYLGGVVTPGKALAQSLQPGATYYWRVDINGYATTNAGAVWSFAVANISATPSQYNVSAIYGYNPAPLSLSITSTAPIGWTAVVTGPNWLSISASAGVTPTNLSLTFNTKTMAAGTYSNNIQLTAGSLQLQVPVIVTVRPLNIVKMIADRQRPYIYALQAPPLAGQNGLLLFLNTTTSNIDKALPIGINPVDLSINYPEGKLYIASWTETWTYVVDLNSQTLLPALNLGTDIYKINAGKAGRIVVEGEDQWVYMSLIGTPAGNTVSSAMVREGDGEYDPTGRYYYHCENNISGAGIAKHDMNGDTFISVASAGGHSYYGSRNLVISQDGSRVFWTGAVYDSNLVDLGVIGAEIYASSTNGAVAFSTTQAYDTATKQVIYNLPAGVTAISTVDGLNQRFWYYNSGTGVIGSIPLSVIQSPSITQQPAASTSVLLGNPVYLTVSAMGLTPTTYQWQLYGTNVPSATNYFLSIGSLQLAQQGDYRVIVGNSFGSVTSTVAQVIALMPPAIAGQSSGLSVAAGQSFSLNVTAGGSAPFTYRWIFENSTISGATSSALTINNAQSANEGIYQVVVGNSVGSATSALMFVRVTPSIPIIVTNPVSASIPASSNATFRVAAMGSQTLKYQWYFNGGAIAGATTTQYALSGIQASNTGSYWAVVTNGMGFATSTIATLTVTPVIPYFVTQPVGAQVGAGSNRTFTAFANGSQPLTYQWRHDDAAISGATSTSLALTNLVLSDGGSYTVVASNSAGSSTSIVAQLIVFQNPTLTQGLTNQVVDVSSTVTLAVTAIGSPTLGYAWQFNGQSIPGTNSTFIITNAQPGQSGFYRVTVTNAFGTASSTGRVSILGTPGLVRAWGDNSGGQTNVASDPGDSVAVAGGDYHSVALHHDGTLWGWGYNGDGQTLAPTNSLRFVTLAAGAAHNLAVTESGSVVAWGRNDAGQCNVPGATSNATVAVAAGDSHSLALLAGGTVTGWGDNSFGQISVQQGLTGVRAIAAGRIHSLALRSTGTVAAWGYNGYGQCTVPAAVTNVLAISAGYLHSAALLSNGTVVVWGDNTFGQKNVPASATNIVAIASGDFHLMALRSDGSLIAWGDNAYDQTSQPAGLSSVVYISAGNYHNLALTSSMGMLKSTLVSSKMVLQWNGGGVLQWSTAPQGPYSDVGCPGTVFTNMDMSGPAKFFRLRR